LEPDKIQCQCHTLTTLPKGTETPAPKQQKGGLAPEQA